MALKFGTMLNPPFIFWTHLSDSYGHFLVRLFIAPIILRSKKQRSEWETEELGNDLKDCILCSINQKGHLEAIKVLTAVNQQTLGHSVPHVASLPSCPT